MLFAGSWVTREGKVAVRPPCRLSDGAIFDQSSLDDDLKFLLGPPNGIKGINQERKPREGTDIALRITRMLKGIVEPHLRPECKVRVCSSIHASKKKFRNRFEAAPMR